MRRQLARRKKLLTKRTVLEHTLGMQVAIYARVSTNDGRQDADNQLRELREYCERRQWTLHGEYVDEVSGGTSERPAFKRLFADAHRRRFDLVLFWALDRFSREGVLETLQALQRLTASGVGWKSLTEEYLDSAGIFKDAIISIMATLAKQERMKISERTKAGLDRARSHGKKLGRPRKVFNRGKAVEMRRSGASFGDIAKEFGISRSHALRVTREAGV